MIKSSAYLENLWPQNQRGIKESKKIKEDIQVSIVANGNLFDLFADWFGIDYRNAVFIARTREKK